MESSNNSEKKFLNRVCIRCFQSNKAKCWKGGSRNGYIIPDEAISFELINIRKEFYFQDLEEERCCCRCKNEIIQQILLIKRHGIDNLEGIEKQSKNNHTFKYYQLKTTKTCTIKQKTSINLAEQIQIKKSKIDSLILTKKKENANNYNTIRSEDSLNEPTESNASTKSNNQELEKSGKFQ